MRVRSPYERSAVLRPRNDPQEILELHWYRSEADYERARTRPAAEVQGMELEEPFPGVVVLPGTQVEELAFDDAPGLPALAVAYGPPPELRPEEQTSLRSLLMALVERLGPALPAGFSLGFDHWSLLVFRDLELLDEIDLTAAVEKADSLGRAVEHMLDRLQDTIAEETADPWPVAGGCPEQPPRSVATLSTFWYGDRHDPVLALEPIPLADLDQD